ncbi:MAG: molybdenum cofactor guanylyltransferase [Anaerolineae bacterium]|jgi:molybdopterin-guanine dinucleotide biosynthesis protein A
MTEQAENLSARDMSAVVLAGGESQRLGMDKALLELHGQTLLARTVGKVATLSNDVIVVTNNPARYRHLGLEVRFVPDEQPGEGALMGLYSGLRAARHDAALAVACDMPFLNVLLLRYMRAESTGYDVVVPRLDNDLLEPLHAIYSKRCLPFMAKLLAQGRRRILAFFADVRVHYVEEPAVARFDPRHFSFVNINTPDDWQLAKELIARAKVE